MSIRASGAPWNGTRRQVMQFLQPPAARFFARTAEPLTYGKRSKAFANPAFIASGAITKS